MRLLTITGILLRKSPVQRGKFYLFNLLARLFRFPLNKEISVKANKERIWLPNLTEPVCKHLYVKGHYELEEIQVLKNYFDKYQGNAIFFDVGANIGLYTIWLKDSYTKAFCFEASPFVFSYLKKNIENSSFSSKVTLVNAAVADKDLESVSFYSSPEQNGKGSLHNTFEMEEWRVRQLRLDSWLKLNKPDAPIIMKADVEGYEYFVFKGMLDLARPVILFEFCDWAELAAGLSPGSSQKILLDAGYTLYYLEGDKLNNISAPLIKGTYSLLAVWDKN